jgi:predicted transcriptional regulator
MEVMEQERSVNVKNMEVKKFSRIIRSVFNLTPKQMATFLEIRQCTGNGTCISNIVMGMDSERSIIQKYLKVLFDKGLITRQSVTLSEFQERCKINNRLDMAPNTTKGYLFLYSPISDTDLLKKMQKITKQWINEAKEFCLLHPVMLSENLSQD